jgi:hypothetical protein
MLRASYYLKITLASFIETFLAVRGMDTKVDGCFAGREVVDELHIFLQQVLKQFLP